MHRSLTKMLSKIPSRFFAAHYPPIIGTKVVKSLQEAVSDIQDTQTVLVGGYGPTGIPQGLINAIAEKGTKNLNIVASTAGGEDYGIAPLLKNKQISRLTTSDLERNVEVVKQFKSGEMELAVLGQGTMAEKLRAGGLGIPAFYTPAGVGTPIENGGIPVKYSAEGIVLLASEGKEQRQFEGKNYLMEKNLRGDWSIIRAWKADGKGNCIFKLGAKNFSYDIGAAGKTCIVEADEIHEVGAFDGDDVHMSGIFVHRVVKSPVLPTKLFNAKTQQEILNDGDPKKREIIAKRAGQEIQDGDYVYLQPGLAKLAKKYIHSDFDVDYVSPSGIFGEIELTGEPNPEVISDDYTAVSIKKGGAIMKSSDTYAAFRNGRVSLSMVEAFQACSKGDLAGWSKNNEDIIAPGPKIDVLGSQVIVGLMEHTQPDGTPNLLDLHTLRLTGKRVMDKLITDMAVFEFNEEGMTLTEVHPDLTIADVQKATGCEFMIHPNFTKMNI